MSATLTAGLLRARAFVPARSARSRGSARTPRGTVYRPILDAAARRFRAINALALVATAPTGELFTLRREHCQCGDVTFRAAAGPTRQRR